MGRSRSQTQRQTSSNAGTATAGVSAGVSGASPDAMAAFGVQGAMGNAAVLEMANTGGETEESDATVQRKLTSAARKALRFATRVVHRQKMTQADLKGLSRALGILNAYHSGEWISESLNEQLYNALEALPDVFMSAGHAAPEPAQFPGSSQERLAFFDLSNSVMDTLADIGEEEDE